MSNVPVGEGQRPFPWVAWGPPETSLGGRKEAGEGPAGDGRWGRPAGRVGTDAASARRNAVATRWRLTEVLGSLLPSHGPSAGSGTPGRPPGVTEGLQRCGPLPGSSRSTRRLADMSSSARADSPLGPVGMR